MMNHKQINSIFGSINHSIAHIVFRVYAAAQHQKGIHFYLVFSHAVCFLRLCLNVFFLPSYSFVFFSFSSRRILWLLSLLLSFSLSLSLSLSLNHLYSYIFFSILLFMWNLCFYVLHSIVFYVAQILSFEIFSVK